MSADARLPVPSYGRPEILDGGEAGTDEVADGFVGLVGNMDEGEFTGAIEAGQREGVAAIGLHTIGGAQGDEGGADEFADDAPGAQMAAKGEAGRSGLVDVADLGAVGAEALVEAVEGMGVGGEGAVKAYLLAGDGNGDDNGFGVDIETDVFDGFHGG